MKKFLSTAVMQLDMHILFRIFLPIAWKIDQKFWINQWQQAVYVTYLSVVLLILQFAPLIGLSWGGGWMGLLLIVCLGIRANDIRRMTKISIAYEKYGNRLPIEAVEFLLFPAGRILHLWIGSLLVVPAAMVLILDFSWKNLYDVVGASWLPVMGVAFYLAAVPPTNRERQKKKERLPLGNLALQRSS